MDIPGVARSIDEDDREEFNSSELSFSRHHRLWLKCLQDVADGKIKRLLGMMPPGSAKSSLTSVLFPTYVLGKFPGTSCIVASYGADLPKRFGRRARTIVCSDIYKRIFDTTLSAESGAVDEWMLTNGSEWVAAGILTGITGYRFDWIVWDDLIKGREQADSDVIRQKTWDAYMDDLMTRKKPRAAEIGISTRWHEDDPTGRILPNNYNGESGWIKCKDGNDWFVVCLQAVCERTDDPLGRQIGERLWPEWFTEEHFKPFKLQPRTWSALFQQRPAPEEGDFFQKAWLKPYGPDKAIKLPPRETLNVYGASDYAVTANGGDYTVHIVVGVDPSHRIWLLDLWRAQSASDRWVMALCDLVQKWKPLGWAEETGQISAAVGPLITSELRRRRLYLVRAQFPTRGDKRTRAQSIRGRMAMDGLYVPEHEHFYPEFRRELMVFDAGRNDDQVDALGLIGQVLDKMIKGNPIDTEKDKPKILSTNPGDCTVTLNDLFEANEKRGFLRPKGKALRI